MKANNTFSVLIILLCAFPIFAQLPSTMTRQQRRLAIEYERLGRYDKAFDIYQGLYNANFQDFSAFDGAKRCLIAQRQFEEAIKFVEDYLAKNDKAHVRADLGSIYFSAGMKKKARDIWQEVLTKNQKRASAYQFVASAMLSSRLVDEALDTFEAGRKNLKNKNLFASEMATILAGRQEYEKATIEYIRYLRQHPRQFSFIERGITNLMAQDSKATKTVLMLLEKNVQKEKTDRNLRALIIHAYMAVNDYDAAFRHMENWVEYENLQPQGSRKGEELFFFAKEALQDGAYDVSEKAFLLFFKKYPHSGHKQTAEYALAQCFQSQGKIDAALDAYQKIIETDEHSFQAENALFQIGAMLLDERFMPKRARTAFEQILKIKRPDSKKSTAMIRIADCYFAEGQLIEAKQWYEKATLNAADDAEIKITAGYRLAEAALVETKIDTALELLNRLTTVEITQNESEANQLKNDALNWLLLLETPGVKTDSGLTLYCGTLLTEKQHQHDKSIEALTQVVNMMPASKVADMAWRKLAEVYRSRGEYKKAITSLEELLKTSPENFYSDQTKLSIGEIYYHNVADFEKARQQLEEFLIQYPRSTYVGRARQLLTALRQEEVTQHE